jgi:hypothetical protein
MKFYKIGNINQWTAYDGSDIILPDGRASMRVVGNGKFSCYVDNKLVGAGDGEMIHISLTTGGHIMTITAEKNSNVMVNIEQGQGIITGSNPDENFVSLEPKRDYSPELYRMELAMRHNQMKMQELLAAERARVDALLASQQPSTEAPAEDVIDDTDKPEEA